MLETKQQYRSFAKEKRKNLDIERISLIICKNIKALNVYKKAKKIAGYYPYGTEFNIKPLLDDSSKEWFLPSVVDNEKMIFCRYETCSEMVLNRFGICEPCTKEEITPEEIDLIIIPALLTDKDGHRLGYGKGYYDRFLARLSETCIKIVPIAEELVFDTIPFDEYDIKIDLTVTENF